MTSTRFSSGAFVFTRAHGLTPRSPEELLPLVAGFGIDPSVVPACAGDRVAIGRAITQASSGLQKQGFLLRPITRRSGRVTYGIVREQCDQAEERLAHDFEATVSWTAEPDPSVVVGDHPIARRVADAFHELRGKIVADDWSGAISDYLERHHAARVRGDGRVFWVPPGDPLQAVRRLGGFLGEVGVDVIICEIEPESRTVVESVAQESLDEQIAALESEAQNFDGTQRPSTYARRLEEYQRLRERAVLYRDALGVGVDRAEQVLTELERKVSAMLDIRRETVVHRDGGVERSAVPAETGGSEPQPAVWFAGAMFTTAESDDPAVSLFVSDDQAAITAAQALEDLGLAGQWQRAGACHVSIKNSGPAGAAVSIRIKLGEQTLESAAKALAGIGIEFVA